MSLILFIVAAAAFAPLVVFWGMWLVSVCAAALPPRRAGALAAAPCTVRIDVLVPAHDEQDQLPALLSSLPLGDPALGRVLVVADHCADATADVARAHGALVLVRDDGPAGKPAALRDGLAALAALPEPGAGVLVLDADCVPGEGFVPTMAARIAAGDAVAQSAYRMERAGDDGAGAAVGLGVVLKNVVRPSGLARLGLPCQLLGTGMLFRTDVLERVRFSDDLVEDVRMSHDLVRAGVSARFVPEADLVAALPPDRAGLSQQRMRWEGGQMSALRDGLKLAAARLLRGDVRAAAALLDWSAPPLSLAVGAWTALTAVVCGLVAFGPLTSWALVLPALAAALLGGYLVIGLAVSGGPRQALRLVIVAPRFLLWKAGFYVRLAIGGGPRGWTRTPRATSARGEVNGS